MELIVVFILIFIVAFIVTTVQLAAAKNRLDHKWNNRYGHRFGDWCYLCVGFWLGVGLTGLLLLAGEVNLGNFFIIIFAQPAISTSLTLKLL